ncbi:A/G-specific adenine glycosylase [Bhargavaea beijingensis]|uniref:Adenine DNA glycosylase n=1 Tax=Bhargavaea beijingensis TaxID=426756 RepID=A0A1G7BC89_9BACL|nr:A/G-specific adenine glycosylase [Bhargavaea beijingensis]MCW1928441.1 A/G-specific adenine glycosylase [Bhargavaea beijingensis]RSK32675.1 A/G-specific adenine glycosylase [Bhargavaea beijingensis]SDE24748.1 A/G-specific DNA-adenine glycosylase [Bhargavaea beijingensis]
MKPLNWKEDFRGALTGWYRAEKRDLPWRRTRNPYHIWISEVMLQQTRVDTVIPYYARFTERFSDMKELAYAPEEELMKMWEGLGYYSRARNLQSAVREAYETYGEVPADPEKFGKLKGVGPYTEGAVMSIAYGIPAPAVDGNVMRVLSRVLLIDEDIAKPKTRRIFEEAVMELIDKDDPSSFNQGLMELGAVVCTPRRPKCLLCPVRELCGAYHEGREEELPVKSKKKKQQSFPHIVIAVHDGEGRWLMEQRPEDGLLAGMWQFPTAETADPEEAVRIVSERHGLTVGPIDEAVRFRHVFTHRIWEVTAYTASVPDGGTPEGRSGWFRPEELDTLTLPNPTKKVRSALGI